MRRLVISAVALTILAFSAPPVALAQKPAAPAATPAPAAPATPEKETVPAGEGAKLKDMAGKEVSVSGRVIRTGRDERSGMIFLDFSRDRNNAFVTVIKGATAKGANLDPKARYEGKDVIVTGVITLFKDNPQIVVTSLEQIQVR